MQRIIIDIEPAVTTSMAVEMVRAVITQGRMSENGQSYCYVTTFNVNGFEYIVECKRCAKSDKFLVSLANNFKS